MVGLVILKFMLQYRTINLHRVILKNKMKVNRKQTAVKLTASKNKIYILPWNVVTL